jgi:hypothetical protein
VYSKETNHKFENNLSLVEFPIEFKTTVDQDPFVVNPVPSSDTHPMTKYPFMSTTSQGCLTAGQITAYATSILSAQYRTHIFFVLILKPFAILTVRIPPMLGTTPITSPGRTSSSANMGNLTFRRKLCLIDTTA